MKPLAKSFRVSHLVHFFDFAHIVRRLPDIGMVETPKVQCFLSQMNGKPECTELEARNACQVCGIPEAYLDCELEFGW